MFAWNRRGCGHESRKQRNFSRRADCPVLALTGFARSVTQRRRAERITIATPSRGLFEFPVVVAMRKGFFKSEGFDVDKIQMQPAVGVKALISGDVDYLLAWGSALRAAVTGVPIKAVVGSPAGRCMS